MRALCVQENFENASKQKEAEARLVSRNHHLAQQLDWASKEYNAQLEQLERSLDTSQAANAKLLEEVQRERQVCTLQLT